MRIARLQISNFRAISAVEFNDLSEMVVIAGPNGCGKSCIFDAIRLLKSAYGGYQPNELDAFFGEFQINANQRREELLQLFQDSSKELRVAAEIELSSDEIRYLTDNARDVVSSLFWQDQSIPRGPGPSPGLATRIRTHQAALEEQLKAVIPAFVEELKRPRHLAEIKISPSAGPVIAKSLVLEHVFTMYEPKHVGIIEHHGANRNYAREQIGGINLNIESDEQRLRQQAMSGSQDKYANLKSTMASAYVRGLMLKEAGGQQSGQESLIDTLKELFDTFFPGKEFVGVTPTADGRIMFPVKTPLGTTHDINDLSSGEKEVLYGYLRLRNTAPRHSVLLIDEPELHLNPRLISGLANFYHRHLGQAFSNQLWLLTHSDTLMRESVRRAGFGVFHMQPAGLSEGTNQATVIAAEGDIDRVVIELVGDLAAYRPLQKIVILEGGGDTEFDALMTTALFPDFAAKVNLLAAGNRARVRSLHELLERAKDVGTIAAKFYSITDSDWDDDPAKGGGRRFQWNVYHIENYLLHAPSIFEVIRSLTTVAGKFADVAAIERALYECARDIRSHQVRHRLQNFANQLMRGALEIRIDPTAQSPIGPVLCGAIERSVKRLTSLQAGALGESSLASEEAKLSRETEQQLTDGSWMARFPGREILSRFCGRYMAGVPYPVFRDLIVDRMRIRGYQPAGMTEVFESILSDDLIDKGGMGGKQGDRQTA